MGVTMSIATSANLLGFFIVPIILQRTDTLTLTLFLNTAISLFSCLIYGICSIPIYALDLEYETFEN